MGFTITDYWRVRAQQNVNLCSTSNDNRMTFTQYLKRKYPGVEFYRIYDKGLVEGRKGNEVAVIITMDRLKMLEAEWRKSGNK